ncbi:MAG TPA: N-acetyltransferase, partial [Acidobacteriota bacterium]|nr:N-acetyltransferase [Acidobacteriota bacterium]
MQEITFEQRIPSVDDYQNLRRAVGWYTADDEHAQNGLRNSLFSICAVHNGNVIGCGRIVGDAG